MKQTIAPNIGAFPLMLKTLQTLAAVTVLVNLANEAKKDRKVTHDELMMILLNGLVPLLKLHGVELDLPIIGAGSFAQGRVERAIGFWKERLE